MYFKYPNRKCFLIYHKSNIYFLPLKYAINQYFWHLLFPLFSPFNTTVSLYSLL